MIQIKRWSDGKVIFTGEYDTVRDCLEAGVLAGIDFSCAKLNGANLNGANLNGAKLNVANLNHADLNGANLHGAKLCGAKLNRAKLNGANLNGAELNGAKLNGANLYGAKLDFSCLPLCCGGLEWNIDRRLFAQLAYHLCSMRVDDNACKKSQAALLPIANEMHRTDVPRLIIEELTNAEDLTDEKIDIVPKAVYMGQSAIDALDKSHYIAWLEDRYSEMIEALIRQAVYFDKNKLYKDVQFDYEIIEKATGKTWEEIKGMING